MSKRLFLGLQVPEEPAALLSALSQEMSANFTGAAGHRRLWEPDGTGHRHPPDPGGLDTIPYHITLRFLGTVECSAIPELQTLMTGIAAVTPPFVLYLSGCATFPDRSGANPRTAWVGVHGQTHLLGILHAAISVGLTELGYAPPEFQFLPHVSVGRFDTNDPDWCRQMDDSWCAMQVESMAPFVVEEVLLYASERDDDGLVTYVVEDRWPLTVAGDRRFWGQNED